MTADSYETEQRSEYLSGCYIDQTSLADMGTPAERAYLVEVSRKFCEKWAHEPDGNVARADMGRRKDRWERTLQAGLPPIPAHFGGQWAPWWLIFDFEGLPDPKDPDIFWAEHKPCFGGPQVAHVILKNAREPHVRGIGETAFRNIVFWQLDMNPEDMVLPALNDARNYSTVVFYECDRLKEISSEFIDVVFGMLKDPKKGAGSRVANVWIVGCPVSGIPVETVAPFADGEQSIRSRRLRVHWHFRDTNIPSGWFKGAWGNRLGDSLKAAEHSPAEKYSIVCSPGGSSSRLTESYRDYSVFGLHIAPESEPGVRYVVTSDMPALRGSSNLHGYIPVIRDQTASLRMHFMRPENLRNNEVISGFHLLSGVPGAAKTILGESELWW